MTDVQRTVTKVLGTQQDLLFGEGQVQQQRAGGLYTVDKIRGFYPCNSLAELNALDTEKFPKAALVVGSSITFYAHNGTSYEVVSGSPVLFTNDEFGSAVDNMIAGRVNGIAGAVVHRVGNVYQTTGYNDTGAGAGTWEVVLSSQDTPNGFDVLAITDATLALKLAEASQYDTAQFGVSSSKDATHNRQALQAALDRLKPHDTLYHTVSVYIENATGTGAGLVKQRADAVANNTLYALKCGTDNITLVNNGSLVATSALDNLLELTGKDCLIKGSGSFVGNGEVLDTNSSDPLVQWRPTLVYVTGEGTACKDFTCVHPTTIGVSLAGSNLIADGLTVKGGLLGHGSGTVLFGINTGVSKVVHQGNLVTNCKFLAFEGKAVYSGIFGVCINSTYSNNIFADLNEHAIYNYGAGCVISKNVISNIATAGAIQCFSTEQSIVGNIIRDCGFGGIAIAKGSNSIIANNVLENVGISGISLRKFGTDPNSSTYQNISIVNNTIDYYGIQSAIDVALECNVIELLIKDNNVKAVNADAVRGPIRLECLSPATVGGINLQFTGNSVNGSPIYGAYVRGFKRSKFIGNNWRGLNTSGSDLAVRMFNCESIEFANNSCDGDGTTSRILYAVTAEGNVGINAHDNNINNPLAYAKICYVPTGEIARRTGQDNFGSEGWFAADNAATQVINTGAAVSCRAGSLIKIIPTNRLGELIQQRVNYLELKSVGNGTFTVGTASGSPTGIDGATFAYEILTR